MAPMEDSAVLIRKNGYEKKINKMWQKELQKASTPLKEIMLLKVGKESGKT